MSNQRYIVFAGEFYYPDCGWEGYHSSHETLVAAIEACQELLKKRPFGERHIEWTQVVDLELRSIVHEENKE